MKHPIDRLFAGIILTVLLTVTLTVLLSAVPLAQLNEGRSVWHVALGVGIAACVMLPRTVLMRTIWRKYYPFILDDEINNMLLGRVIGLVFGAMAAMYVLVKIS